MKKKCLLLFIALLLSGCAIRFYGVENVKNLPEGPKIPRYKKPSITIELVFVDASGGKRTQVTKAAKNEEVITITNYFRKSKLFSRIVQWRKTSDILLNIELTRKSSLSKFWESITFLTVFVFPNIYITSYELKAVMFDDINKKVTEYKFKDKFITFDHVAMLPFAIFSNPSTMEDKIKKNMYKALVKQIAAEKITISP